MSWQKPTWLLVWDGIPVTATAFRTSIRLRLMIGGQMRDLEGTLRTITAIRSSADVFIEHHAQGEVVLIQTACL